MLNPESLAGCWHLLDLASPVDPLPPHRVDIIFHIDEKGLKGAVLGRDGREVPLQHAAFDGTELRLQMAKHPDAAARELPFLVMTAVGDHFEGHWSSPAVRHIQLKLIRSANR